MKAHIHNSHLGVIKKLAEKHSKIEISQILDFPYQAVHRFCVKHEIECVFKKIRRDGVLTEKNLEDVIFKHRSGVAIKDIAIEYNVRDALVADIIREAKEPVPRLDNFDGRVVLSSDFRKRIGHFLQIAADEGVIVLRCQYHGDMVLMTKNEYCHLKFNEGLE